MRKQRWLLGGLVVALLGTAAIFLLPASPGPAWTRQDLDRLHPGMTVADVESILGCAPGDYRSQPSEDTATDGDLCDRSFGFPVEIADKSFNGLRTWRSDTADFALVFDPSGKLRAAVFYPVRPCNKGVIGNFLWRVRRLWRECFSGSHL